MTLTTWVPARHAAAPVTYRFRLQRAGILNVWQYDDQEFRLADGRMLLRGANGAGKSKTLEMLLPFVLDGDKARITASARHHTSLLWLMTDGYEGQTRVGYLWVEFARPSGDGEEETFTCGVGIRSSASARSATSWYFTTSQRIGHDLGLEDDAGPMSRPRLAERLGESGQVFEHPRAYKEHIGRTLFGLGIQQYDEMLRLLYWLRQPQVGEDIEPARLAGQLAQALPQLDEQAVRAAGDTFDELAAFGEQIDRRSRAADALSSLASAYARYARSVAGSRGTAVVESLKQERRLAADLRRRQRELEETVAGRHRVDGEIQEQQAGLEQDRVRIRELEASPEARDQRRLGELAERLDERRRVTDSVEGQASRAADQCERREQRLTTEGGELVDRLQGSVQRARDVDRSMQRVSAVVGLVPPTALGGERLADVRGAERLVDALEGFAPSIGEAGAAVGLRQAAVTVVRAALDAVGEARRRTTTAEERAAEAEQRWEASRARRVEAEQSVETEEQQLWAALQRWVSSDVAPPVEPPAEITPSEVVGLPDWARAAAAPRLGELRGSEQAAVLARDRVAATLTDLARRRAQIEQQVDPAPPEPVLARTPRVGGAPLWGLVDFAEWLSADERAGLEAALQTSGLLDAWVRPDGAVLDAAHRDTVLPVGRELSGSTLADVLLPDSPPDADVTADVVGSVLRRVGLGDAEGESWLGLDGSWRLGALQGRAEKAKAQYVGATARSEERRRRLREIDEATAQARAELERAEAHASALAGQIAALEDWARRVPATQPLLQAWARLDERASTAHRDERDNAAAQQAAHAARRQLAEHRQELDRLARDHEVPTEADALAALEQRLRGLADEVRRIGAELPGLARDLRRWAGERAALDAEAQTVASLQAEATAARERAEHAKSALSELESAVGATVRELQQRLAELHASERARGAALRSLAEHSGELRRAEGKAEGAVAQAESAVAEHRQQRSTSLANMAELAEVSGLLESAFASSAAAAPDLTVLRQVGGVVSDESVPAELGAVARALADLAEVDVDAVDVNAVWRAYNEATSGPAADYEPRVIELGDLVAVTGRDEGSESPIGALAARVAAGVSRDRELLTQRERERFEQHILGELGDAIRGRRLEAHELVEAMNGLLAGVTTSQGIRVRLDWRLRDDVSAEAAEAVRLLAQPVGALLPEERATLRDSLHRLIEASRAERPELSYSEHLASALDYREWSAFRIRYTRPEAEGRWLDLHRRSPLSQGEQKVLCYLPLFAAAAAHFTSLAGAAPHAPRLVLLDDAFPKIDVRTHPLLFGLLVQLDLDFVVTSERLWGDHETVPSLAIYEALRDPSQRGIAQFEYRWDGRQLRAIG